MWLFASAIARAFSSGWTAHPEDQIQEENEESY